MCASSRWGPCLNGRMLDDRTRTPLPTEQRLCWMFAFGNDRELGAPVAHLGKPPPLTSLVASSSGDPSKLVIDGYVTKQAARVRLILAGGKAPLDLEPLPSGSDVPVNFFVAVLPWPGSKEQPGGAVIALDRSGGLSPRAGSVVATPLRQPALTPPRPRAPAKTFRPARRRAAAVRPEGRRPNQASS